MAPELREGGLKHKDGGCNGFVATPIESEDDVSYLVRFECLKCGHIERHRIPKAGTAQEQ